MRVLHVISDTNIGGAGVLLCNLLTHFSEDVRSAVALPRDSLLRERLIRLGIPIMDLTHSPHLLLWRSVKELMGIIKREQINVVHANASLSARVAARLSGCCSVHTRHCFYPVSQKGRSLIARRANDLLTDAAIATSPVVVDNLLKMGIQPRKIHVVVNGSRPVPTVPQRILAEYRQKWGIEQGDFTVGICARLEPCKGIDVFLQAAREVIANRPALSVRFLIAGCGSRETEYKHLSQRLGIADRVTFTGFLSDTAPFYRLLHLNVNCSRGTETSCLALSEGMSAGVPVVASDYGGNPLMVGEEGAGFLFPIDNAHALASAICELADDPHLRRGMSQKALERYRTHFTAHRMAQETEEIYRQVLCQKEKG